MSGTPSNVGLWANADVYIAPLGTALPADASTAFPVGWEAVGLLDGDAGFEETREEDKADHFAWGGILVATTRKNFKLTKKFTALEDPQVSTVIRSLVYPGSSDSQIVVPVPADTLIAFETYTGGKVKRMISHYRAQVEVDSSLVDNESDMSKYPLVATIYPSADGILFDTQGKPSVASLAITPLTLALSLGGANIGALTATATYSDASTADVTASALWSSATPAKATVSAGYVTGVTTGTASISCTFGGVTSAAPCVATVSA
jgi:hypothetical protein